MQRIQVVTDTAADLSQGELESLGIAIVPLIVTVGDRSYEETTLTNEDFWRLADGPIHPRTSQPAVGTFVEAFRSIVQAGDQAFCITVTGHHSGTYNSASLAAQEFGAQVTVVDSRALSIAQGYQAQLAARMAQEDARLSSILEAVASLRKRTHVFILLDTTEFLRRGGRAARLMPTLDRLARALSLKPLLTLVEGELKLAAVVRTRPKGMVRMLDTVAGLGPLAKLAVMHVQCPEVAAQLADQLAERTSFGRERIDICEAGCVLACHAGRGVVAVTAVTV